MTLEEIAKNIIAKSEQVGISKEKRQSMARIGTVKLLSFVSLFVSFYFAFDYYYNINLALLIFLSWAVAGYLSNWFLVFFSSIPAKPTKKPRTFDEVIDDAWKEHNKEKEKNEI